MVKTTNSNKHPICVQIQQDCCDIYEPDHQVTNSALVPERAFKFTLVLKTQELKRYRVNCDLGLIKSLFARVLFVDMADHIRNCFTNSCNLTGCALFYVFTKTIFFICGDLDPRPA